MARITLKNWMASEGIGDGLDAVFATMADCGVEISAALRTSAAAGDAASLETVNVQGEVQKALDVVSNDIILRRGAECDAVAVMVSEELEDISPVAAPGPAARYGLVFDPLDGSSNLDVNGGVGTIFSVLDVGADRPVEQGSVLQAGTRQVAAGYILYGPATVMVLTTGRKVAMFALDEARAEFVLTDGDVRIPAASNEFSINMSRYRKWHAPTRRYIEACLEGKDGPYGKSYNMRWCGAMVADVHRILCRGGVFLYPTDTQTEQKGGRLRLLYEANPMGMIVEAAGGAATTGPDRILEVVPDALHQRIGVIMGSREEVERAGDWYSRSDPEAE